MKLYHCANARSLRVLWALEELQLEYDLVTMEFPPRSTYPGYLDLNPMGTVPTFVDGDVTMTESSAICHYLAEKYGPTPLAVAPNEPDYADYLNWMYRSDSTLTCPQTLVLRYTRLEPPERRPAQVVEDCTIWYLSRLKTVEAALADREFLVADRFTMADITVAYALFLGTTLGLGARYKPNCQAYLARVTAREGCARAMGKQQ
jgi:glutathione S-transferase